MMWLVFRRTRRIVLIIKRDHGVQRAAQFAVLWGLAVFITSAILFEWITPSPNPRSWMAYTLVIALSLWSRVAAEAIEVIRYRPQDEQRAIEVLIAEANRRHFFYDQRIDDDD